MTKPALDNGFIQIACGKPENDILTALASANLNGTEYALVLLVIRKTWGWKKNWDHISISQFSKVVGTTRRVVIRNLQQLVLKSILVSKTTPGKVTEYSFNERFFEWTSVKNSTSAKKDTRVKKCKQLVSKTAPTKDNITKESNTKVLQTKVVTQKNIYVECLLTEFEKLYGFPPTDKKPRFVAQAFRKNIEKFLKVFDENITFERFEKVAKAYFDWLSSQDYAENIQTLDTIRRKFPIWSTPQVTKYQKGNHADHEAKKRGNSVKTG